VRVDLHRPQWSTSPRSTTQCSLVQVTAMHLAAEHGHFALITLLMEHGGDATALDGHRCGVISQTLLELQLSVTSILVAGSLRKGWCSLDHERIVLQHCVVLCNTRTPRQNLALILTLALFLILVST